MGCLNCSQSNSTKVIEVIESDLTVIKFKTQQMNRLYKKRDFSHND